MVEAYSLPSYRGIFAMVSGVFVAACGSGADPADASLDPLNGISACARGLDQVFSPNRIAAPAPDSNGYRPAAAAELTALADSLRLVTGGSGQEAVDRATDADYTVCRDDRVVIWEPVDRGTGRAVIAWRQDAARGLIVEVPHAIYDLMTLEESLAIFDGIGARSIIASGTHRCANAVASGCDGTTGACGEREDYRESDMAHAVDTAFQVAHEVLSTEHASDWIASVHGMGDAGASISDGTMSATDADAPVANLAAAMLEQFPAEQITTCNDYPGAVVNERLCGTTNTQGRFTNGSSAACTVGAAASAGRFLHMEQSTAVRAEPDLVVEAFDAVVPAL